MYQIGELGQNQQYDGIWIVIEYLTKIFKDFFLCFLNFILVRLSE